MSIFREALTDVAKFTLAITPTNGAAGTSAINSTSVDMKDYEGVCALVLFGAITSGAATSFNLAQSADDTTFSDLTGSKQTIADTDDEKAYLSDLIRPTDRYVRIEVARATQNAVVSGAFLIQYRSKATTATLSANQGTAVQDAEQFVSPAEGTA